MGTPVNLLKIGGECVEKVLVVRAAFFFGISIKKCFFCEFSVQHFLRTREHKRFFITAVCRGSFLLPLFFVVSCCGYFCGGEFAISRRAEKLILICF